MVIEEEKYLRHYGILRKSGRYPWGSGNNPTQRSRSFLDILNIHKQQGLSDSETAKLYDDRDNGFPFTLSDLRATKSRSVNLQTQEKIRTAMSLQEKGMGFSAIGRQMGLSESTVRSLLEPGRLEKLDILQETADMLKRQVEEKEFVDVGAQVQLDLPLGDRPNVGISKDKFNVALSMVKEEGYSVHPVRIPQAGTGEFTNCLVLVKPGVTQKDVFLNTEKIKVISEKTDDGGKSYADNALKPPLVISAKRVGIRYKEDGGDNADGVIYVRPGVQDVTLGKSTYAQVRIAIDGTHYLKGMAIYKDDLPKGIDLQFNTNKSDTGNKLDAMKPVEKDKDGNVNPVNPFGASIKPIGGQIKDADGNVISSMNKVNDEGDWDKWSKTLSRQMLSKQTPDLAESQLNFTYDERRKEFEKIKALTNPTIKRKLLESFSDETDSSAVHLKAAHLPRQATKVLIPITSLKPTEIFAPTFHDGERVALVRFPHAGTFEIPELVVNNRNREARKLFSVGKGGNVPDAIGIHPRVAAHLSGADFDGDAVVVIPNDHGTVKITSALEGLKGFDSKHYQVDKGPITKEFPEGTPIIKDAQKQNEMGKVSNLITDMTIRGATREELAQAVRHSMVVIDSEKHNLDFRASERDNNILALKKRYQGRLDAKGHLRTGASTLISRATARQDVNRRKDAPAGPGVKRVANATVDIKTGKKVFVATEEIGRNGKLKTFRSKKLAETDDAFSLVSEHGGTREEQVYAKHSNRLKALANESRLEMVHNTTPIPYSKSAKHVYSTEVAELNAHLNTALKNAPLERQAQVVAKMIMTQRRQANPEMDAAEKKKISGQALDEARLRTGAGKTRIQITPRQWEAIQAGAISNDKLKQILNNTDMEKFRELATPRKKPVMNDVVTARAKAMLSGGATFAEVSAALGIPMSTLKSGLSPKEGG